jgi:hypothetical protein
MLLLLEPLVDAFEVSPHWDPAETDVSAHGAAILGPVRYLPL